MCAVWASAPLGRGPAQGGAGQDVGVDVEDGLAGLRARVEDQPELAVRLGARDLVREPDDRGEQGWVGGRELRDVAVMSAGHDEHMQRSLGMEVPERDDVTILGDDVGRDLPGDDPAEQALGERGHDGQAIPGVAPGRSVPGTLDWPRTYSLRRSP